MPYPFLSAEWIAAAREIREKYEDDAPRIDIPIRMNQIVTKVPFGDGTIKSHLFRARKRMQEVISRDESLARQAEEVMK